MVGKQAKFKGKKKKWWRTQTLFWQGEEIKRDSDRYQELITKAYDCLFKNEGFRIISNKWLCINSLDGQE